MSRVFLSAGLVAAALALVSFAPVASAWPLDLFGDSTGSCKVNETVTSCRFPCASFDKITVQASGKGRAWDPSSQRWVDTVPYVTIAAECGGATAGCSGQGGCAATGTYSYSSGWGTCSVTFTPDAYEVRGTCSGTAQPGPVHYACGALVRAGWETLDPTLPGSAILLADVCSTIVWYDAEWYEPHL